MEQEKKCIICDLPQKIIKPIWIFLVYKLVGHGMGLNPTKINLQKNNFIGTNSKIFFLSWSLKNSSLLTASKAFL